jgi:hypothetical protein
MGKGSVRGLKGASGVVTMDSSFVSFVCLSLCYSVKGDYGVVVVICVVVIFPLLYTCHCVMGWGDMA